MRPSTGFYALVLAAGLVAVSGAYAQNQPSTPPSAAAPATPSANIPEQKIDAAAAAVKGVSAVRDNYEQKLSQAPQEQKKSIASEAEGAMRKAVTDAGLSVSEYTTILQVARNDPAVRDRLMARLK
jgi:hypothetical protein